jgi:hypothetical protein
MTEPGQGELRLEDELAEIEREIENEIEKLTRELAEHECKRGGTESTPPKPWAPPLIVNEARRGAALQPIRLAALHAAIMREIAVAACGLSDYR